MSRIKKFRKVATNIKYYSEWKLKCWQRIFYNPPRTFVSTEFRNTRVKADKIEVPNHVQFGMTFNVLSYSWKTERVG